MSGKLTLKSMTNFYFMQTDIFSADWWQMLVIVGLTYFKDKVRIMSIDCQMSILGKRNELS